MIKNVQIISEGKVIVKLSLKDKQNEFIKKDATAFIGSDGLIGNKIVIIRPGSNAKIIENGDTINSYSPTDTQELFNIAKEVGTNTRSITDDLKLISSRLSKGEGVFGELLHDGQISSDVVDSERTQLQRAETRRAPARRAAKAPADHRFGRSRVFRDQTVRTHERRAHGQGSA